MSEITVREIFNGWLVTDKEGNEWAYPEQDAILMVQSIVDELSIEGCVSEPEQPNEPAICGATKPEGTPASMPTGEEITDSDEVPNVPLGDPRELIPPDEHYRNLIAAQRPNGSAQPETE